MIDANDLLRPEFVQLLSLGCAELQEDYHGVSARIYDSIQGGTRDVGFYLRSAGQTPATILELGSGTGRVAIPLAEAGHTVYALDSSADMHAILRDKAPEAVRERLVRVEADMCDFSLGVRFDFVILALNTVFTLVDEPSRRACLQCVSNHLRPNGRFLVDFTIPTPALVANKAGTYSLSVHQVSAHLSYLAVTHNRYDIKRQLSVLNFLTIEVVDGRFAKAYVSPAAEYYPSLPEMRLLIESVGMHVAEVLGDYDGHPYTETGEARDVIMVCVPSGGTLNAHEA